MGAGRSTVSVPFSGFHAHFVLWFAGYAQRTFTCSLPRRKSTGSVQRPSGAPRLHTVMYALCAVLRPSETHVSAKCDVPSGQNGSARLMSPRIVL